MPLGLAWIAPGVINAVDLVRLRGLVRCGGHGEIGVAARFAKHLQFIIHAAPATIRSGIVQGPIAVNEPVSHFAGLSVVGQKLVPLGQKFFVGEQPFPERGGAIAIMVQVNLHFPEAMTAQTGQGVQVIRVIGFQGIEEGVPGRPAIAIAEPSEKSWIVPDP